MGQLEKYGNLIESILKDHAAIPYSYGSINQSVLINSERTHFLLFNEGWDAKQRRVHGCVAHIELKDEKIWIHYDGIEEGITPELIAAGVPKANIVLAFQPPELRQHTGYAVA